MDLQAAVIKAVDDCIRDGILAEFLTAQRAEVIAMSIFEYDQEKHIKQEKEESWEDGYNEGMERGMECGLERGLEAGRVEGRVEGHKEGIEEGMKKGRSEGQQRMLLLLQKMSENGEMHLADKLQDEAFLFEMYEKYNI